MSLSSTCGRGRPALTAPSNANQEILSGGGGDGVGRRGFAADPALSQERARSTLIRGAAQTFKSEQMHRMRRQQADGVKARPATAAGRYHASAIMPVMMVAEGEHDAI